MSVNSVNDISEYILDKFSSVLDSPLSEYEKNIVRHSILLPYKELSTSKALLGDAISEATKIKAGLEYISLRLKDQVTLIKLNYQPKYNKLFTVLTRQGRPSKAAIDCEINSLNPDMYESSRKMESIQELQEFLINQMEIIDMIIRNAEHRRYEL